MGDREITYSAARGLLVAALAGHLEGNIVGGVALDLKGTSREVVEVLVDQLDIPCVVSNCDNLRLEGVEGGSEMPLAQTLRVRFRGGSWGRLRRWPTWQCPRTRG